MVCGFLHSHDYKTRDLGKRSLRLATGKDAGMARKDYAVSFLCRYDGEVILLYEHNILQSHIIWQRE